ncbi:hypothetical protein [Sphingomonas xinjiangensis]|uniref:Uncharacterized protein n=1 Tax=Sphingomonas xinjiangensis TaxID=643568 RepID=A0A840YSP4_9SPHN|nr:hypothetical protein [Sphingomonas xinjiangensis]MBB5712687.1 hypothetical protein [Sphingomonas xinjiangensis]
MSEEERLAVALACECVKALAEAGDMDGVRRWMEVSEWLGRRKRPEEPTN